MERLDKNWQHFLNKLLRYYYSENAWEEADYIVRILTNKKNIYWKLVLIKLIQIAMMSPALTLSRQWITVEFYLKFMYHLQNYMEIDGRAIIKFRREHIELAFINKVELMRDVTLRLVINCIEQSNCIIDDKECFYASVREIAQPNEGFIVNPPHNEPEDIEFISEENNEVMNFIKIINQSFKKERRKLELLEYRRQCIITLFN